MNTYHNYFKDKKVTVMGLGLLGRGVGDAAYIAEAGAAEVIVTDLKSEAELADSCNRLKGYKNITWRLGEHCEEDFSGRDLILVAAGVPDDSPYLAHARKVGVRLAQSAALFAELSGIPIVGVTGTRGKSTVTYMIHHVLEHVTGESVLLGGNIRGVSNLQLLNDVHEDSLAVLELDSWQLQGWGWAEMSPQVAVFTSFMPDHLNYYQREGRTEEDVLAAYFADKANIFRYQEGSGVLITTPEVFQKAQAYARATAITIGQGVTLADVSVLPDDLLLATPGEHNRLNAALAYEALRAIGLTDTEINEGLASFPGVPGRLQYCGIAEPSMVGIYNDNNATTPNATVAGLAAVGNAESKNVILIAGGADKGLDVAPLVEAIETYCAHAFLLPGTGTDKLASQLPADRVTHVADVAEAVNSGLAKGEPGQILLFSPGFASFEQFKNEYERNDTFLDMIRTVQDADA